MKAVIAAAACPACGDDVEILTRQDQREAVANGAEYWALDGDDARCVGCGLRGVVTVEDQIASLSFAE